MVLERVLEQARQVGIFSLSPWEDFEQRRVDCIKLIEAECVTRFGTGEWAFDGKVGLWRKIALESVPTDMNFRYVSGAESRIAYLEKDGIHIECVNLKDGVFRIEEGKMEIKPHPRKESIFSDQNTAILARLQYYAQMKLLYSIR